MTHDDITARTATVLDYFRVARDAIDSAERHGSTLDRERIGELERDLYHARAEIIHLRDQLAGERLVDDAPVVEEEQGPWVIYDRRDKDSMFGACGDWSNDLDVLEPYPRKDHANERCMSYGIDGMRVITLAEARARAGAK